ncbi:hypothetical protein [Chryseobacterium sp.]|uniref:hypothetical protein n=1 Tax=Chryseobacterium sp. TaxID=1871047 RepID=UPI0032199B8D
MQKKRNTPFIKGLDGVAEEIDQYGGDKSLPAGIGRRASSQFDIGGETGYKSGIFAPRF